MAYIGIDLHSNRFTCNFLQEDNKAVKQSYFLYPGHLDSFFSQLSKNDYVLLEASTNSFAFYDLLKSKVKEVKVVNPLDLRIIYQTGKKTDKVDSEKLSKILRYQVEGDEDFINKVYVPEEDIRKLRSLFTSYKLLKKQVSSEKNRIHSILKQILKPYTKKAIFSKRKKKEILNLDIAEGYKTQIKILYETVEFLEKQAEEIKEEILYTGRKYKEEIKILTSMKGISVFIALALISDYADIRRFKNAKKFSSYMRSVPRIDASNTTVHIGKTNKRGRKLSISLLLQSLHHTIRSNRYLKNFYLRKQIGKSIGKVRMAVVRKLFVTIYYMLREKEYYRYRDVKLHERKVAEYERFLKKYKK